MVGASELMQAKDNFAINIDMPKSLLMENCMNLQTDRMLELVQDVNRMANLPGIEVALCNWNSVLGVSRMDFLPNEKISVSSAEVLGSVGGVYYG